MRGAGGLLFVLGLLGSGCRPGAPRVAALVPPTAGPVVVVAPHPDDETLAAGGLITRLVRAGVPVRVVFVTDGDGWPWDVQTALGRAEPTAEDFRHLGATRRAEARAAAARLGLAAATLTFLGYPDGGLAALWDGTPDRRHPYRSPFTHLEHPAGRPATSGRRNTRADLLADLVRIVQTERPTLVLAPHPADIHPDHATVARAVAAALAAARPAGAPAPPPTLTYLIHHPLWPPSPTDSPTGLPPPPDLAHTDWRSFALSPAEQEAKAAALAAYPSQLAASAEFLGRFMRANEIFGTDAQSPTTPSSAPTTRPAAK